MSKDIIDRNNINRTDEFEELIDILSSSIVSLLNEDNIKQELYPLKKL